MRFVLNKPFVSANPVVEVDAGLPPGLYRFQLVAINERGQRSEPCEITVTVTPAAHEIPRDAAASAGQRTTRRTRRSKS